MLLQELDSFGLRDLQGRKVDSVELAVTEVVDSVEDSLDLIQYGLQESGVVTRRTVQQIVHFTPSDVDVFPVLGLIETPEFRRKMKLTLHFHKAKVFKIQIK